MINYRGYRFTYLKYNPQIFFYWRIYVSIRKMRELNHFVPISDRVGSTGKEGVGGL